MPLPKLLYLCINDGSDTRINKEIKTLSTSFDIVYLGIGRDDSKAFAKSYCRSFHLVKGNFLLLLNFTFQIGWQAFMSSMSNCC